MHDMSMWVVQVLCDAWAEEIELVEYVKCVGVGSVYGTWVWKGG